VGRRAILAALIACELAVFSAIVHVTAHLVPHEMVAAVRSLVVQS